MLIEPPSSFLLEEEDCSEELISGLIENFEEAIERGLPPSRAIAAIIEWAAQECARLEK
jgi:hypothetical protein